MTTRTDVDIPLEELPEQEVSTLKDECEETVDFLQEPMHVTAEADLIIDKHDDMKTIDSTDNDITEDEQLNTKRSRELKMLLALSKEANLDTNISYKRKSIDTFKLKELTSMSPKPISESDNVFKKLKVVEKADKFPITAESELEAVIGESGSVVELPVIDKNKKEELKGKDIPVGEERKNIKDIKMFKPDKDMFCWRCHREGVNVCCETCPRSYHQKCLKQTISDVSNWPCPECVAILKAESTQTRSPAMKGMTLEHLCSLLKFAVKRMIECNGSEPFLHAVNDKDFPEYKKYIIQPMNLTLLEKNIKENLYGSTQAFEADAKWILHNSIIFNSYQSKLTTFAKTIIKICKQEMAEIENCPSCYLNANTKKSTWFVEVCPKPHILVWAKLKGFPYWPAKAMCTNSSGMVDVRFFGAHDRAWVPSKECFLYSRRDPNSNKQKRNDIIECMREVEVYISNIKALYGEFNYAPFKLPYDPDNELKQLLLFIPRYRPNAPPPRKRSRLSETKGKPTAKKDSEEKEETVQPKPEEKPKESMEGYGTDDDTNDTDLETLDTKQRAMLLRESSGVTANDELEFEAESDDSDSEEEEVEKIEAEMDDDTQVSSNIPVEKLLRGNVRTRGGLTCSPGKIKIIPRRISEEDNTRKRLSTDETPSPNKITRRNSDQSIRSDFSRLSTLSDKINRVDISENVELTLGNTPDNSISSSTTDSETRKKPVQIDVENSELSISPQSKIKITDRLMKKLSTSDEELAKSAAESEQPEVKSQTDILLEKYKNLVKEKSREFASIGTSTSFGTTSVPTKDSCESSSDLEGGKSEEKVETDKKGDTELELESPNKKEDGKSSINEKIEAHSSEMSISSTENSKNVPTPSTNVTKETKKNQLGQKPSIPEHQTTITDNEDTAVKVSEKAIPPKEDISKKFEVVPSQIQQKKDNSNIHPKKNDFERIETKTLVTTEVPSSLQHKSPPKNEPKPSISTTVRKEVSTEKKCDTNVTSNCTERKGTEPNIKIKSDEKQKEQKVYVAKKSTSSLGQNIEKSKNIPTTQPESNKIETNKEAVSKDTGSKTKINSEIVNEKKTEETNTASTNTESKNIVDNNKMDPQNRDKEDAEVLGQIDSNSSNDQDVIMDDTQIDEANIRNIIHSSLNKVERAKRRIEEISEDEKSQKKKIDEDKEGNEEPDISNITKKPRLNTEEKELVSNEPNFKIVPIQSILNKNIEGVSSEYSVISDNPILLKKLSQPELNKNILQTTNSQQLVCVEIKSEPESSDQEMEENEYMEKKRKYLSALNISERTEEAPVPKKHEIRTRSKTEEMGKGRPTDNLSKVIEEVATTYSAKHETVKKTLDRKINNQPATNSQIIEDKKKATVQENGEIFVKSFAKIPHQQQQIRAPQQRPQNTQKPKPNNFQIKSVQQPARREVAQKPNTDLVPTTTLTRITPTSNTTTTNTSNPPAAPATSNKTIETLSSPGNVLILTQPGVILPTSQQLAYNAGSFVTFVPSQQNMAMMQTSQVINAVMAPGIHQNDNIQSSRPGNIEIHRSQNYIPQHEEEANARRSAALSQSAMNNTNLTKTLPSVHNEVPALTPINESQTRSVVAPSAATESRTEAADDEFSLLHSMVPESVSRAISEVLCRPPPKLKPRPPGPLSQVFDTGNPSSAGPVSAKINSISHRLGDYFRGMLIEMLEDLGKSNNPEATISSLKLEIESLQHKHSAEMMDIRKNVCTILKDIQGSIAEERERIVDETRSACELEAVRRIEEAKSKQWCANCGKEAQFYCCWNTSYCDYPCQQKHWSKHMSKCTQHAGQPQPSQTPAIRPQSQITFRPATPKTFTGRIVAKPTKVYLNRSTNPKAVSTFKSIQSTPGGHLALVDTSNLEFLTSTSMGAKFIASSSLFTKVKSVNSTVTSPSNGTAQPVVLNQKVNSSCIPSVSVKASPSTSNNVPNVISDEEFESE